MNNQRNASVKSVPFFRPSIGESEIEEVVACLRSGWLTTGPLTKQFEQDFSETVHAKHAVAVNSCTAAMHLAVEALELKCNQAVLVPTMTFAATAEIVCYQGAIPILVDCDPGTLNLDLNDAEQKLADLRSGRLPCDARLKVVGVIPVHVAGAMLDMDAVGQFASQHGFWVVEDSAHALPAAFRSEPTAPWRSSGENSAAVTCFSFYANKTITTGEGGMAVTDDPVLATRMRQMSLHGFSHDAWTRYSEGAIWDYRILAPGYKYNLTDIASAIGIHQLQRAESLRLEREQLAAYYLNALADIPEIELPATIENRILSWHLFPIRLCLENLKIDRKTFMAELRRKGISCSVHWRPLHLHHYYQESFGWQSNSFPVATAEWKRLISLPLFPGMQTDEQSYVVDAVQNLCNKHCVRTKEFTSRCYE